MDNTQRSQFRHGTRRESSDKNCLSSSITLAELNLNNNKDSLEAMLHHTLGNIPGLCKIYAGNASPSRNPEQNGSLFPNNVHLPVFLLDVSAKPASALPKERKQSSVSPFNGDTFVRVPAAFALLSVCSWSPPSPRAAWLAPLSSPRALSCSEWLHLVLTS